MFISNIGFVKIGFFPSPNWRHGNRYILFYGECNRIFCYAYFVSSEIWIQYGKRRVFHFTTSISTQVCVMCLIYIYIWILYCYYYFVSSFAFYVSFQRKQKELELYIGAAVWKPFFIVWYKINMIRAVYLAYMKNVRTEVLSTGE